MGDRVNGYSVSRLSHLLRAFESTRYLDIEAAEWRQLYRVVGLGAQTIKAALSLGIIERKNISKDVKLDYYRVVVPEDGDFGDLWVPDG